VGLHYASQRQKAYTQYSQTPASPPSFIDFISENIYLSLSRFVTQLLVMNEGNVLPSG